MSQKKPTKEKIKATRTKIRTHVKQKGESSDFCVTESFCLYWWHRLNEAVFDGMLTPPAKFEIREFRDCLGWCLPWRPNSRVPKVKMGISSYIWDRKEFLSILAHEMVHQWEWEITHRWEPNSAHGERFFSWKGKLKSRVGLPLEKTY